MKAKISDGFIGLKFKSNHDFNRCDADAAKGEILYVTTQPAGFAGAYPNRPGEYWLTYFRAGIWQQCANGSFWVENVRSQKIRVHVGRDGYITPTIAQVLRSILYHNIYKNVY